MIRSGNDEVQNFSDHIKDTDPDKYIMLTKLREIVFGNYPNIKERMMYGGIMFSLKDDIGGIFVYKNHISFEFGMGYKFNDPDNILEGKGEYRRHLKLRTFDDIETKKAELFIKQIKEFDV